MDSERSAPTNRLPPVRIRRHTGPMHKPEYAPTAIESQAFEVSAHEVWAYRLDFAHLPDYSPT